MALLLRRRLLSFTLCALAAPAAWAQGRWPARPLTVVVPYAPGGGPDILARLFAEEFGKTLGPAVVENRPGMGGSTGADYVAKAAPDGHTLLLTTTATHSINPALYPNVPYDPARDFSPIARVAVTPTVLVVANDVPARTVQELVEHARRNPGKLSYASTGAGTMQHMAAELLRAQLGLDLLHVPYKGSSQVMPDLLAGRVSMMFNSPAAVLPFVDQGKLRALAVTSTERLPRRPAVPTMAEAGVPGFEASAWYALYGPLGVPREVVQRLAAEVARIVRQPDIAARIEGMGMEPAPSSPEQLAQIARADLQKWSGLIKSRKIKAE
jgi:tripartite-type tricarboxylate transporter receptor subunit TctC